MQLDELRKRLADARAAGDWQAEQSIRAQLDRLTKPRTETR